MFDFLRWRQFLSDSAVTLNAAGFTTKLRLSDHSPKPGTSLDVSGQKVLANFANWNTGEADYEIIDTDGKRRGGTWGLMLNDDNFQAAFDQFTDELRRVERD